MAEEVLQILNNLDRAHESKDVTARTAALEKLHAIAEAGDATALTTFGHILNNGLFGNQKDELAAFDYYERSVRVGTDPEAFGELARIYNNQKNYNRAYDISSRGAEMGDAESMRILGICYLDGSGISEDKINGVRWLKKSGDLGNINATALYALALGKGDGVTANPNEALRILLDIYENKDTNSAYADWIADIYKKLNDFANSNKWRNIAAEGGDTRAKKSIEADKFQNSLKNASNFEYKGVKLRLHSGIYEVYDSKINRRGLLRFFESETVELVAIGERDTRVFPVNSIKKIDAKNGQRYELIFCGKQEMETGFGAFLFELSGKKGLIKIKKDGYLWHLINGKSFITKLQSWALPISIILLILFLSGGTATRVISLVGLIFGVQQFMSHRKFGRTLTSQAEQLVSLKHS